jgi:hypothetical protein
MLRLIEELLTNYGTDPEITAMVDNMEIWINPNANPDGTYYMSDDTVSGAIRSYTTTSGGDSWVDPNRNFPDVLYGDHPDGNEWWPETVHQMELASAHNFVIGGNFHGGAEVLNYPWDYQYERHPDDEWYIAICRAYADQVHLDGWPGYLTDYNDGITNGYDWYSIHGGRQDYMNYWHSTREITFEVSMVKNPSASQLNDFWTANRQALLDWLNNALTGIRGKVTDSTGTPLDAQVEIPGHDHDGSWVYTDPDTGNYHRMLLPGTYKLHFTAEGFVPVDVMDIVVNQGSATRVDVVMGGASRTTVYGQVTSRPNDMPLPGATVELVGTNHPPVVTSRSGYYSFRDVVENTYTFRVSAPGFETVVENRNITLDEDQQDFGIYRVTEAYATDLEADNGGLEAAGTPSPGWEWGEADADVGANSGMNVWGTGLSGDYQDQASWTLTLSKLPLPDGNPTLSFWHLYSIEPGYDGGNVQISNDGGQSWSLVVPEGGYPTQNVSALGEPGFSGLQNEWTQASFDLSPWAKETVFIRLVFGSDGSVTEAGWYIDDITVTAREMPKR